MDNKNISNIGVYNPQKQIAEEVTLNILIRHRNALQLAREGTNDEFKTESKKQKYYNRVKGLNRMISAQRDMIVSSNAIVKFSDYKTWERNNKEAEKKISNKFEDQKNAYNSLLEKKRLLEYIERDIMNAERTSTFEDDYLLVVNGVDGERYELTEKFYDMLNGLEETYEEIYLIMLKYRIVSNGEQDDEIFTYKEQEEQFISDFVNA
jgi:hypothetical protein